MTYKDNADILTWKRVIDNLQEKTDEVVDAYNDAQNEASIGLEQSEEINTEHYKVVGCSITAYWNYYEQEKHTVAAKDEPLIFRPDEKKIIQTFS